MVRIICQFVFLLILSTSVAETSYVPESNSALTESWRWTKLEALDDYYVFCCLEDDNEDLWFACSEGLVRYSGFVSEKIELASFMEKQWILDFVFVEDDIYLAAQNGLYVYAKGEWRLLLETVYPAYPTSRKVFTKTAEGIIFAATDNGLFKIEQSNAVRVPGLDSRIRQVVQDENGVLWVNKVKGNEILKIPTLNGIVSERSEWKSFELFDEFQLQLVFYIDDRSRTLWISNGNIAVPLIEFDMDSETFEFIDLDQLTKNHNHSLFFVLEDGRPVVISKSYVLTLAGGDWSFLDVDPLIFPRSGTFFTQRKNGNLVLGGRGESIYQVDTSTKRWESFQGLHYQCSDAQGNEWFLSLDGDVIKRQNGEFVVVDDFELIDTPVTMICSRDDTLWIVGSHKRQAAISYLQDGQWKMSFHPEMGGYFNYLSVIERENGELLFGSGYELQTQIGGYVKYHLDGGTYTYETISPPEISRRINGIAETPGGDLWFGGLRLGLKKNEGFFSEFGDPFEDVTWIDHVSADSLGNLWAAVWQKGLFRWDHNKWDFYTAPDSIARDQAVHLLNDQTREGAMWVATQGGISYFNGSSWISDALPKELGMNREGGYIRRSEDGSIWINYALREWFYRHQEGYYPSTLLEREFRTIHYYPDRNAPDLKPLGNRTKLIEPANIFIEWEGMDYRSQTPQSHLSYSWRVNGGLWSAFEKETDLLLLNQKAGIYEFEVVARDSDGNQSEPVAFQQIEVAMPVWKRSWFVLAVLFAVVTVIVLLAVLVRMRIRKIVEFEEFKIQFFANMSHELRTPLTAIMGPLQSLSSSLSDGSQKKSALLAHKNAQKMLQLVDQILDFRKAELGKSQLLYCNGNIVETIEESIDLLKSLADSKGLSVVFTTNKERCLVQYDADKLRKIIDNLLSNAIKYTGEGGLIQIRLKFQDTETGKSEKLLLSVEDDGRGIPKSKIKHVFDPFYRIHQQRSERTIGSGLGLALTRQLVAACNGEINVESPVTLVEGKMKGTRFLIELPLKEFDPGKVTSPEVEPTDDLIAESDGSDDPDVPLILIAEDDIDICEFLTSELQDFRLLVASNGAEGLRLAENNIPDLIVSDVLMPEMGGLEFCSKVKENRHTCHIPVILLTALKGDEHEIKGLECGADDYITKPIDLHIFKKRVNALLENRKRLHKRFSEENVGTDFDVAKLSINTKDQALLNNVNRIIEMNLENSLFDVQFLSDELKMSRMTLYRKFIALTGESPSHFIKAIRLKKAAELLKTGEFSITQIAEKVGINTSGQFSTAFKKQYYCSPSQYARKHGTAKN